MKQTFIKIGAVSYDAADYAIPAERTFRNAWQANTNTSAIFVDMDAAKDIWRDKIRQARTGKLEALDAEFMKALESGADTTAIATAKQALRDAPSDPSIHAATTPEALTKVQPAGLTVE